jgi:hypothetical protein
MPVIPALRRLRQENSKFEANLGYKVRSCLKKQSYTSVKNISCGKVEVKSWKKWVQGQWNW